MNRSDRIDSKPNLKKENSQKECCNLESFPTQQSDGEAFQGNRPLGKVQSLSDFIEKLWQHAMAKPFKGIATLFPALPEEADLKIEKEKDRYGNTHWRARDPWTGKSVFFVSESEVLRWIDSLYRQSH
jgi:hypothetical protein